MIAAHTTSRIRWGSDPCSNHRPISPRGERGQERRKSAVQGNRNRKGNRIARIWHHNRSRFQPGAFLNNPGGSSLPAGKQLLTAPPPENTGGTKHGKKTRSECGKRLYNAGRILNGWHGPLNFGKWFCIFVFLYFLATTFLSHFRLLDGLEILDKTLSRFFIFTLYTCSPPPNCTRGTVCCVLHSVLSANWINCCQIAPCMAGIAVVRTEPNHSRPYFLSSFQPLCRQTG